MVFGCHPDMGDVTANFTKIIRQAQVYHISGETEIIAIFILMEPSFDTPNVGDGSNNYLVGIVK